jgi:molybdate transport system substrate-binding protein
MLFRAIFLSFIALSPSLASANELIVLASAAGRSALQDLAPKFERDSGLQLIFRFDTVVALQKAIKAGERFDVALLTTSSMKVLTADGSISPNDQKNFASAIIGVAVKHGAVKPDISTVGAFTAALMAADKITYAEAGASGQHFKTVVEDLRLQDKLGPKLWPVIGLKEIELVADGQATLGIQLISEILAVKGVDLVGPIPDALQSVTELRLGVGTRAAESKAAIAFIAYASSKEAAATIVQRALAFLRPCTYKPATYWHG